MRSTSALPAVGQCALAVFFTAAFLAWSVFLKVSAVAFLPLTGASRSVCVFGRVSPLSEAVAVGAYCGSSPMDSASPRTSAARLRPLRQTGLVDRYQGDWDINSPS